MNFNSKMLKISIVIALVFMLIPIVAAEDATDSAYAQDQSIDESSVIQSQDEISEDTLTQEVQSDIVTQDSSEDDLLGAEDSTDDDSLGNESGGYEDYSPYYDPFISVPIEDYDSSADLKIVSIVTPQKLKVGDYAIFTFLVTNKGPDMAKNVVAYANVLKGDVLYISSYCSKGIYDSYTGVWRIGDLESGDYAVLMVLGKVLTANPIYTVAYVTSATPDPDESNNYFMDIIDVEGGNDYAAESKTLPATGNPIVMVLLAVLTIVGVTVVKRD